MIDSVPYFIARISEDRDFFRIKEMAENHDGWKLEYDRSTVKVWTKKVDDSNFNMVKVWAIFLDVSCIDLYDTIQDSEYRKQWDNHMIVGIDIGYLNPNNDVSYYAMHCPPPIKNRDFVLQKSWLDTGTEFYIINHSVCHKDYPPKNGFIRAISYFTGYFIRSQTLTGANGSELSYVTRSDPQGDLPSWFVNKCTQILAPRYIKQMEKAASQYSDWKRNNNPHFKPWTYPEQITSTKLSIRDCIPSEEELAANANLRKFNFNTYLLTIAPQTSRSSVATTAKRNVKSSRIDTSLMVPSSTNELAGKSSSASETQLSHKSNTSFLKEEKKSKSKKSKLISFLNCGKICGKKTKDE